MPLPWVRLDSNIHAHDKVLALLSDPSPKRWQALGVYVLALGWSGGHGTDGVVREYALKAVHGTPQVARLLVKHQLWDEITGGWSIRNFADRQQLSHDVYTARKAQKAGSRKGNCVRHHGPECGCWQDGQ